MDSSLVRSIGQEFSLTEKQIRATIELLNDGATIPFIARYRKEQTENLDELQIAEIQNRHEELEALEKRREFILDTIKEQGKLTKELREKIIAAHDSSTLEDLYLPFKKKKQTKADIARKHGLEPLAKIIFSQEDISISHEAKKYLSSNIKSEEEALSGARTIIAEWINEDTKARTQMRTLFKKHALITSKVIKTKEADASKYKDYFKFQQSLLDCPSHRFLAIQRGKTEGFLRVSISPPEPKALSLLEKHFVRTKNESAQQIIMAIKDSYKRLLGKSMENEFTTLAKEHADDEAIEVFSKNLRQLLLEAPLGHKRILSIDPGYRTGCKVVVLDSKGELTEHTVIYLLGDSEKKAASTIIDLIHKYKVEAIAVGNGTASRETEKFVRNLSLPNMPELFVVSEDGASIYSASEIARAEFPDKDVTVRGAISIGRRLMDPLAELVKIDPKSIGIGQYQHDVDQSKLKKSLDFTVESCVNHVGINLNTASKHLLLYVSGLGPALAENIITYRTEHGRFRSRKELLKVPKLGKKAFEQSAGFLRITNSDNPLDNSAVHPERYTIVKTMAKDLAIPLEELIGNAEYIDTITVEDYVDEEIGVLTLNDILKELKKPGRDPRGKTETFKFRDDIHEITDLETGMILPGIVTNITNFGAFVDIGVHCDGLVHISQLSDEFVSDPNTIVSLHQKVDVKVMEIDLDRKRIGLSMKVSKDSHS
ncbi:RNA-binding transcriptional accessory protein [Candidatus Dojkabacteria bacterium]|uniref:RNA-binding transcriptional accessory protein n=1 Tax=Candidatus Dojkabacteria bacterium TaxID=2099670 RepID=A0A955L7D8_9BACT|nr:RNA-binding transcriptional accessory protein [Candidatus Dojkabacteria bacterium]